MYASRRVILLVICLCYVSGFYVLIVMCMSYAICHVYLMYIVVYPNNRSAATCARHVDV